MFSVPKETLEECKVVVFPFLPELRKNVAPANLAAMEWMAEAAVQDSFELADIQPNDALVQRLWKCPSWQSTRALYLLLKQGGRLGPPRPRSLAEYLENIHLMLAKLPIAIAQFMAGLQGDAAAIVQQFQLPLASPAVMGGASGLLSPEPSGSGLPQSAVPSSKKGATKIPIPELAFWPENAHPWPCLGKLTNMVEVHNVYYVGDPAANRPALHALELKYGSAWRSKWKQRWQEFKELLEAIKDAAEVRQKGALEAAQFWASKQGGLSVDQQRLAIKNLRGRNEFKVYVNDTRPPGFVSPLKVKRRQRPHTVGGCQAEVTPLQAPSQQLDQSRAHSGHVVLTSHGGATPVAAAVAPAAAAAITAGGEGVGAGLGAAAAPSGTGGALASSLVAAAAGNEAGGTELPAAVTPLQAPSQALNRQRGPNSESSGRGVSNTHCGLTPSAALGTATASAALIAGGVARGATGLDNAKPLSAAASAAAAGASLGNLGALSGLLPAAQAAVSPAAIQQLLAHPAVAGALVQLLASRSLSAVSDGGAATAAASSEAAAAPFCAAPQGRGTKRQRQQDGWTSEPPTQ